MTQRPSTTPPIHKLQPGTAMYSADGVEWHKVRCKLSHTPRYIVTKDERYYRRILHDSTNRYAWREVTGAHMEMVYHSGWFTKGRK